MWQRYDKQVKGCTVEGDPAVPATRWWNHLWLLWWGWKTVAVFEVYTTDQQFLVGYRDQWGLAMINTSPLNAGQSPDATWKGWPRFNVLVGREGCTFFVVDMNGNELPLRCVELIQRRDRKPIHGRAM